MGVFSVELILLNLVFLCLIVLAFKLLINLLQNWKLRRMLAKWERSPKNNKVILHTIWRGKTIPALSPFGFKLETYLSMAKIPFEIDTKDSMGSKGKMPWITYNGTNVADSHLAIQFLNTNLGVNLNKTADEKQVAIARACRVMLEERFFWCLAQFRVIENAPSLPQLIRLPAVYKYFAPIQIRMMKSTMKEHGIGRHASSDIYQMADDDLRTLSKILGNDKFFGGNEEPCEEDCGIFGLLGQVVWAAPGSSYEGLVNGELSNLKEYCERMKQMYWPDWDMLLDKS